MDLQDGASTDAFLSGRDPVTIAFLAPEHFLEVTAIDLSEPVDSVSGLFSYAIGVAFGRWDIRYATGERPVSELPDPFAPLPACPPGMLQSDDGLPLSPEAGRQLRAAGHYPLDIAWGGILVDDEGGLLMKLEG